MLLTLRRLGPKSVSEKTVRIIHSAQRTFTRFPWFPILTICVKELFHWAPQRGCLPALGACRPWAPAGLRCQPALGACRPWVPVRVP